MTKELEILFNSKPRVKILKFFFFHEGSFSLREVREGCRLPSNLIQKELKKLSRIGLLKKETKKRRHFFILSSKFPFFLELRSMVLKSQPLSSKEVARLFGRTRKIKVLVLTGIFLREERSPIDILIVGDNLPRPQVQKTIKKIEDDIGKEIRWSLFTPEEYSYRLQIQDRFLRDIFDRGHKKIIDKLENKR